MQEHHNHQAKSAAELLEEFKQKYNYRGNNEVNLTKMQNSDTGMQEQVTAETTAHDSISFGASGVGISLNSEGVDPITESIRKEILQKQREQLRLYLATLSDTYPELAEHILDDERFSKFLANLNGEHRLLVNDALASKKLKAEMEEIELVGYRNIHNSFKATTLNPNGFKPMDWRGFAEVNSRTQIVKNGVGDEICTLKEQTHKTSPLTISKQDGSVVLVNAYRTIDLPVKLEEPASGTMHLSLVAKDKDGQAPSVTKAVYFTAHYEATPKPNGVPKLKEVSSPQPIKFLGSNKEAIGYIEHGGEIYTLPVTKGKYEEMMKEIAKNQGQAVDLSLAVESKAQDLISSIEQVSGAEIKRVTGEGLVKSGLAEKLDEETINNATDLNEEQIKHHKAQLAKYKKFEPYINETAKHYDERQKEATNIMNGQELAKNLDIKNFWADQAKVFENIHGVHPDNAKHSIEVENTKNNSREAVGKIKDVLKAGGKLGFNVVLESLKVGGVENYVKQKAIEESKKVGSYVANSIADRIKATLSGKSTTLGNNSVAAKPCKSYVVGINQGASKSSGVSR